MNQRILTQWLKSGYIDQGQSFETIAGVPQGGTISPTIANMVLDGLSAHVANAIQPYRKKGKNMKVLTVRYADDFIVTCESQELLQDIVIPAVNAFLRERGLILNQKKTHITDLRQEFDFLGFNIRVYPRKNNPSGEQLLIKPAPKKVQAFRHKLKAIFKENPHTNTLALIKELNPILRGWTNYYRTGVRKKVFSSLAWYLWHKCLDWSRNKSKGVGVTKILGKYFTKVGNRRHVFFRKIEDKNFYLFDMAGVPIKRHRIIRDLNPYLIRNSDYFLKRKHTGDLNLWDKIRWTLLKSTKSICPVCDQPIVGGEGMDIHHITPKKLGGTNDVKNLVALHRECHIQVTHTKNLELKARFEKLGLTQTIS
jgi:RNA-directed DNA polymerase